MTKQINIPFSETFRRNLYRIFLIWGLALICYGVLCAKIFAEQFFYSDIHQNRVERQTIRRVRIPGNRGTIYASDGTIIAETRPSYDVVFHISSFLKQRRKATIQNVLSAANRVAVRIQRPSELTEEIIQRHMNARPGLPLTVFTDLSQHELAAAVEMPDPPSGMEIHATPVRAYPLGRTACHLLGWVGKADRVAQPDSKVYTYYDPDMIGRQALESVLDTGIELAGQTMGGLRGSPGERLILVNAYGYPVEVFGGASVESHGNNVYLTLDIRAQELAEQLLADYRGAFVVTDVATGDIIAMASNPGYDLNMCVPRLSAATYQMWATDTAKPLHDRATREVEMPGSIIKPLVALAIMQRYPSNATVVCNGGAQVGNRRIGCTGHHGSVALVDALKHSCNTYFVTQGVATGLTEIQNIFRKAGIGSRPKGYILGGARGVFPSDALKRRVEGRPWNIFDTALISIGQGKVAISPLQAALYMAAIANGGVAYEPNLIRKVVTHNGKTVYTPKKPQIAIDLEVTSFQISQVQLGMKKVVEAGGTGRRAQSENAVVYGKTGTAEVGSRDLGNYRTNTWFAGFAKHKNGKTYAFATLIENGRAGGYTNAPLISQFFNQWVPCESEK